MVAIGKSTVRTETKAQFERHRKAAKALRWSVNRFYLEAADKLAETVLASEKPVEQLMVETNRLALNQ